jgi:predicted oxidoreductase
MFSEIIAGVMRWGSWGANHSKSEVSKLINACVEADITTFDHADIYGGHTTEALFGEAFVELGIAREKIQLISKAGIQLSSSEKKFDIKSYNYSSEYLINCVDESLRNLKTDYLDLFLLHRPSPLMNPEEIAETFDKMKQSGKVKYFGVSNFLPHQFELLYQYFPLVTNQIEISVNETKAFFDGTLEQLMAKKLRPMAWSVMGNYFTQSSEQNNRLKIIIDSLCEKYNAEENQLLLAFLLKHPSKIYPVIGTADSYKIQKLSQSKNIILEDEDWFRILEASRGREVD